MTDKVLKDTGKTFARAHELSNEAELLQHSGDETAHESILRLCYRIAEFENVEEKDEYTQD